MGRLELGASTYNGKWANGNWLTSWGVDFNYFVDNLQTRGEWLESYRQMPNGQASDNRQGWYIQAGYFLNGLNLPFLPDRLNSYLHRLEPLVRYSGVNQRGVSTDDIAGATGVGLEKGADDKAGRCIAIIGAPGSGKSALAQHLTRLLAEKPLHGDTPCPATTNCRNRWSP